MRGEHGELMEARRGTPLSSFMMTQIKRIVGSIHLALSDCPMIIDYNGI